MRRATVLLSFLDPDGAAAELTDLARAGVASARAVELPPEADAIRTDVRAFAESVKGLPTEEQRRRMIETGYVMPNWPKPYGRDAGAVEQLVIEQEFEAAGIKRPGYGVTGWVILTLIQYGTPDQIARWVNPGLDQGVVWCQLFSEPDAGSDAAGIKTRATRVDGGWTVARATLGNESVSIGGGQGGMATPGSALVPLYDAHPERLTGGTARVGHYIATHQAMGLLNLRSAHRAVAGAGPGPEGAMTKLVLSELGHEAVAIQTALHRPDVPFMDGAAGMSNFMVLMHRGMSIAGGTSEIKRNQIGERILGLPRDPLVK